MVVNEFVDRRHFLKFHEDVHQSANYDRELLYVLNSEFVYSLSEIDYHNNSLFLIIFQLKDNPKFLKFGMVPRGIFPTMMFFSPFV